MKTLLSASIPFCLRQILAHVAMRQVKIKQYSNLFIFKTFCHTTQYKIKQQNLLLFQTNDLFNFM